MANASFVQGSSASCCGGTGNTAFALSSRNPIWEPGFTVRLICRRDDFETNLVIVDGDYPPKAGRLCRCDARHRLAVAGNVGVALPAAGGEGPGLSGNRAKPLQPVWPNANLHDPRRRDQGPFSPRWLVMSGDPFWHAIRAQRLDVPPAVMALHSGQGTKHYVGQCDISRGSGVLARLALRLAGFPSAGQKVPTRLTINTREGQSEWVRDFGGHVTRSHLSFDAVRCRIIERFGPVRLTLSLGVIPGKIVHGNRVVASVWLASALQACPAQPNGRIRRPGWPVLF